MKVLVIVDPQVDFVSGSLKSFGADTVVWNIIEKIEQYWDEGWSFACTMDRHFEDYLTTREGQRLPITHCVTGTEGICIQENILALLKELAAERGAENFENLFYEKSTFASFELLETLQNLREDIEEIEVCGFVTDICVISNALMFRSGLPEVKITVDAKCCAGTKYSLHKCALQVMESCHIDVKNWADAFPEYDDSDAFGDWEKG